MVGSLLRRNIFYLIDTMNGSKIKKHYQDIKNIMNDKRTNYKQLNKLLKHAKETVPYYKEIDGNRLEYFPIVTKNDIKENYGLFRSQIYMNKPLHQMSTSGSTGTPFTVLQNLNKRKRTIADLIYFNDVADQRLGDRFMYIKAWPRKRTSLERVKQNVIPIDILHQDGPTLEKVREILKRDSNIKSILAYASSYDVLANYLLEKEDTPDMFNIKTLFSSSTLLSKETKEKLTKIFNCKIIDRYSNQENGVLAQTSETYGDFKINRASYFIELLKLDSDTPVGVGELGRIVVTDLFNFAMPMIRYDTGDLAKSDDINSDGLSSLQNIQGRRVDVIYDTKGRMLTPHTWSVILRKYRKLRQWQFIQEDKTKYVLKVNGGKGVYSKKEFDDTLRSILGSDAEIEIQFVDGIPISSSGKFKNTICNYKRGGNV